MLQGNLSQHLLYCIISNMHVHLNAFIHCLCFVLCSTVIFISFHHSTMEPKPTILYLSYNRPFIDQLICIAHSLFSSNTKQQTQLPTNNLIIIMINKEHHLINICFIFQVVITGNKYHTNYICLKGRKWQTKGTFLFNRGT